MDIVIRKSEQLNGDYDDIERIDHLVDYKSSEWSYLRTECENLELENFYTTYVERLQRSYLTIFFIVQTIITLTHITILAITQEEHQPIFPEVYLYVGSIILIWLFLVITFKESIVRKHIWLPYVASCATIFILIVSDLYIPLYHGTVTFTKPPLRPAYASHILIAIYIFLPLSENWHAILMGIAATACYLLTLATVTYRLDEQRVQRLSTDAVFLLCANLFGIYFRIMSEVAIRKTFLDRRECVEGNLMLKFERDQEKDLLLSILPKHTAEALEKDITDIIRSIRTEKRKSPYMLPPHSQQETLPVIKQWRGQAINKLYVEKHTDVTVLYADVVNYTYMTTKLPVKKLVETLHELFVKFDQASEEFNVLRIKFLGDCYYCVSGVPVKNARHAKNCVDLGLRMIRDIRNVRQEKNLNIDMRIGVHSGTIISGVIGACKWQYDIWSRDVSIANKMESTGLAGRVHITQQTLDLLDGEYVVTDGTMAAKFEPILLKYNIKAFLIESKCDEEEHLGRRHSLAAKRLLLKSSKSKTDSGGGGGGGATTKRNFMGNSMEQYRQIMRQTNVEMANELNRMPIGKLQFPKILRKQRAQHSGDALPRTSRSGSRSFSNLSSLLLCFSNKNWELSFLNETDLMLKYSVLMFLVVFLTILAVQTINHPTGWIVWFFMWLTGMMLTILIPITWFRKLWIMFMPVSEENGYVVMPPTSLVWKKLYDASLYVMNSGLIRTFIFLLAVILLVVCSLIHLVECTKSKLSVDIMPYHYNRTEFLQKLSADTDRSFCLYVWDPTQSLTLAICLNFLFVRISFLLKLITGILILAYYTWIVFVKFDHLYELSASINPAMDPKLAHIMTITMIAIIFHLIDLLTEYISRVDYNWKQQLLRKQKETAFTKDTNRILVQNILPAHVAEIYMSRKLKDELYYEEYDNVAVMFATITNYDISTDSSFDNEKGVLNILNEIICDFDERLLTKNGSLKIEKIKVAGWTYMAACGLDPGRGDSSISLSSTRGFAGSRASVLSNRGRSFAMQEEICRATSNRLHENSTTTSASSSLGNRNRLHNPVYVLAEFALALMQALDRFNCENFQDNSSGQLRIGISNGRVMAGVVGSSKPLYDIWGNAVNMASRMDTTGIPGRLQVTSDTAQVLESFGIECKHRGMTNVKGAGLIPTYFVGITDKLEFVRSQPSSLAPTSLNGGTATLLDDDFNNCQYGTKL